MIRYSHVSLVIPCDGLAAASKITEHLKVNPSLIRTDKTPNEWMLDSPQGPSEGDPGSRLRTLAQAIEPLAPLLATLPAEFKPKVEMIYHMTPRHSFGITGEFDWVGLSPDLMRRFSSWNLPIIYEVQWFNHPDWVHPNHRCLWCQLLQRIRQWRGGLRRSARR